MVPAIVVTGGAGYIGSHTAFRLAQSGFHVIVVDSFVHQQRFAPAWTTIIQADYADKNTLSELFSKNDVRAVMHFAACIEVGESVKDPLRFYENNVSKTITLLEMMQKHKIDQFIFSSSCAVYGTPQHIPLTEDHPHHPISPYGKTKAMIESIIADCHQAYGLKHVSLRYFNAAGALPEERLGEQHKPETHIIPRLLQSALYQKPFDVFGTDYETKDGTAIRDYLHVLDIADAHAKALTHLQEGKPSDAFNLGTGHGVSVKEMVDTVQRICNTTIPVNYKPRRVGDPALLVADPTKAHTILEWQPQYSQLDFIVQSALAFERSLGTIRSACPPSDTLFS